ncbi:asmA family protein, partial [Vibrio parahaemolyticus V-223/04]
RAFITTSLITFRCKTFVPKTIICLTLNKSTCG